MLSCIDSYMNRAKQIDADMQVLATSRPNSYDGEFSQTEYLHLRLARLEDEQVNSYVDRWIEAKIPELGKANRLREIIAECLADAQLSLLMTTPLQVTIMVLVILGGGTPPRQKEALFNEYLETIYKREKSKSKSMLGTEKPLLLGLHAVIGYLLQRRASSAASVASSLSTAEYMRVFRAYLR